MTFTNTLRYCLHKNIWHWKENYAKESRSNEQLQRRRSRKTSNGPNPPSGICFLWAFVFGYFRKLTWYIALPLWTFFWTCKADEFSWNLSWRPSALSVNLSQVCDVWSLVSLCGSIIICNFGISTKSNSNFRLFVAGCLLYFIFYSFFFWDGLRVSAALRFVPIVW